MDGYAEGKINRHTDGWKIDGSVDGWLHRLTKGLMNGKENNQTDKLRDRKANARTDTDTNMLTDVQTDKQKDRNANGWTDKDINI